MSSRFSLKDFIIASTGISSQTAEQSLLEPIFDVSDSSNNDGAGSASPNSGSSGDVSSRIEPADDSASVGRHAEMELLGTVQ